MQNRYVSRIKGPYGMVRVGDTVTVGFYYGADLKGGRYPNQVFLAKVLSIIIGPDMHWIHVKDVFTGDTYYPLLQHVWSNE